MEQLQRGSEATGTPAIRLTATVELEMSGAVEPRIKGLSTGQEILF